MDKKFHLTVDSDTTHIIADSTSGMDIARLAQLAGIMPTDQSAPLPALGPLPSDPATPMGPQVVPVGPTNGIDMPFNTDTPSPMGNDGSIEDDSFSDDSFSDDSFDDGAVEPVSGCSICGGDDHGEDSCPQNSMGTDMVDDIGGVIDDLDEEVETFDFGNHTFNDSGEELDQNDYIWQANQVPQRYAHSPGDNAMVKEYHKNLLQKYSKFLAEDDRENESGVMSPLSDSDRDNFDKDPMAGEKPVDDGSHSPLSTIERQKALK